MRASSGTSPADMCQLCGKPTRVAADDELECTSCSWSTRGDQRALAAPKPAATTTPEQLLQQLVLSIERALDVADRTQAKYKPALIHLRRAQTALSAGAEPKAKTTRERRSKHYLCNNCRHEWDSNAPLVRKCPGCGMLDNIQRPS